MKRLLVGSLVALGLAVTAAPAMAGCYFESCCSRHCCFVWTGRTRCLNFTSYSNPLPCMYPCGGYCAPSLWNSLAAYGYPHAAPAVPVAAAPAAAAPAAAQPPFRAPQPSPAIKNQTGLQQAVYSYYGQSGYAGYGANGGYNPGYGYYGYGANYSYAQAPNYWY